MPHRRTFLLILVLSMGCGGQSLSEPREDAATGDARSAEPDSAGASEPGEPATGGPTGNPTSTPTSAQPDAASASSDCAASCQAKASGCGTPASEVPAVCLAVCGSGTPLEQACVQWTSCDALANAFGQTGEFCGIGCADLCAAKAATCGAPSSASGQACAWLCSASPTPDQVSCVLGSACSTLESAFAQTGTVCGIGALPDAGHR